ncbi:hypothetical protein BV25DRAFT_1718504 [Artomyces pyxidatus]|uniref:Uncharacterized protein n=1 Tax=Artomyces pyxidatus TaxID=48021 RepID=A0ACB8SIW6_9AGAM|nr:hypothetical protein BV25DRAFT_1718504 [Artomyces pyxidatus]
MSVNPMVGKPRGNTTALKMSVRHDRTSERPWGLGTYSSHGQIDQFPGACDTEAAEEIVLLRRCRLLVLPYASRFAGKHLELESCRRGPRPFPKAHRCFRHPRPSGTRRSSNTIRFQRQARHPTPCHMSRSHLVVLLGRLSSRPGHSPYRHVYTVPGLLPYNYTASPTPARPIVPFVAVSMGVVKGGRPAHAQ